MKSDILKIHERDNVAVALVDLTAGTTVGDVVLSKDIPFGHKVALVDINCGENIIKYGMPLGHATSDIKAGDWVHTHNVKTNLSGVLEYQYEPEFSEIEEAASSPLTFKGYKRPDGQVGIRNEVWIIPTVGCVNKTAELLAKTANANLPEGVDEVLAYPHPFGCSQLGDDHKNTQKILAGLVHHPNAAGVLILGLGCENNTLDSFLEVIGDVDSRRVKSLIVQNVGNEFEVGGELLEELVDYAATFKREDVPLSELKIGLKCGGSDALSGITANPLVGCLSDMIIAHGGTSVLTEVPEMFGAETLLMNRCADEGVFNKCVDMVNGFKEYFMRHNQVVYENPSPGNKAGGITTLEEKSLGCTQKGGTGIVVDVLEYGDRLKTKGLNLLSGPGNDLVACSVLAAAGAHIVFFTTGRGTPYGGPVPTVKVATNSRLAEKKQHWIDFNAGALLDAGNVDVMGKELFTYMLKLANGEIKTRAEENGFRELAIFKDGVTL